MSEQYGGPLDLARAAAREAAEWDGLVISGDIDPNDIGELHHVVQELDSSTPLLGKEVRIIGRMLVPYMCTVDGERALSDGRFMVSADEHEERGMYRGFAVRNTCYHDDENGGIVIPRVVHMLNTGAETFLDSVGNVVMVQRQAYFPASAASVMPIQPRGAHSLEDLRYDRLTSELDDLLLNDDKQLAFTDKLHRIAQLFRYECRKYRELTPLILQQLSYLNDADILENSILETRVVIRDMDDGGIGLYGLQKIYGIAGESFHLSNISITNEGGAYLEAPELYIKGLLLSEGRQVSVPVRHIVAAHTVESYGGMIKKSS